MEDFNALSTIDKGLTTKMREEKRPAQLGEVELETMSLSELKGLHESILAHLKHASEDPDFDWSDTSYLEQLSRIEKLIGSKGDSAFIVTQ